MSFMVRKLEIIENISSIHVAALCIYRTMIVMYVYTVVCLSASQ